jgi:hypothetical protein
MAVMSSTPGLAAILAGCALVDRVPVLDVSARVSSPAAT